jgi:hypothetical protein
VIEAGLAFHAALLNAAHNELLSRMEVIIGAAPLGTRRTPGGELPGAEPGRPSGDAGTES